MTLRATDYPPGMIAWPCGSLGRYSDFTYSLVAVAAKAPPGTTLMKGEGLGPARPLNGIAEQFMLHPELKWLFLTNDDNLCPVDTIIRLLNHNVDVVSGLYFGRLQPFEPIMFDRKDKREGDDKLWYYRHMMQSGETGLQPAVAVGDGCLLIQRHVLEAIPDPWWEYGETESDCCDHDVVFSRKVRNHGFGLWVDTDLWVDHIANFVVRPHRDVEGNWSVRLVQGEERMITLPAPTAPREK